VNGVNVQDVGAEEEETFAATRGDPERAIDLLLARYERLSGERDGLRDRVELLERQLHREMPEPSGRAVPRWRRVLSNIVFAALAGVVAAAAVVAIAVLGDFWKLSPPDEGASRPPAAGGDAEGSPQRATHEHATQGRVTPASPDPRAAEAATPPAPTRARLELAATRGATWLQVRRGSGTGRVMYDGTLEPGRSLSLVGRRLWLRFAVGDYLAATINGKPVTNLPALAADAVVTPEGLCVLSVG
jgi:hypothetical protein